jgi:glycine cleavage system regulatory protein
MYTMRMRLDVPEAVDDRTLREHLEAIAGDLHIEVTLEKVSA